MVLKRKNETKRKLTVLGFDELNVFKETDRLYSGIERDCKAVFWNLYCERYAELWLYLKGKEPGEDELDELVEMYLAGLFEEPNENTHYAFSPELVRKRDRAKEAVLSVPTKVQKQLEMDKAVRIALQQIGWYTDFVSQGAELQAYKDAGVKKVQRHEMNDGRVCADCRKADGKVYDIDKIPPLPHLRCRRWFTPVTTPERG